MADDWCCVERRDDGVAVVTLDNPKVNALSRRCCAELQETPRRSPPTRRARS